MSRPKRSPGFGSGGADPSPPRRQRGAAFADALFGAFVTSPRLGTVTAVLSRTDPRGDYVEIRWDESIAGNRFCRREDRVVVGERVETSGSNPPHPIRPQDLFEVDNGALLCRAHLGSSAARTGRDISGLPIRRLSVEAVDRMRADLGDDLAHLAGCETCRAIANRRAS